MKAVLSFFLIICVQLFSWNPAHAVLHRTITQSIAVKAKAAGVTVFQNSTTGVSQENDFPVIIEDEDEEEVVRKQTVLPKFLSAFFSELIARCALIDSDNIEHYSDHSSAVTPRKYILQRVLRI